MNPAVHPTPGELPSFWDRSVVFFANLLSLFYGNASQREVLVSQVGGIECYGGRLLPILSTLFRQGDSLLVLEREPDDDLMRYFERDLGLALPDVEILGDAWYDSLLDAASPTDDEVGRVCRRIRLHPAGWVDGFVTDERLVRVATALGKQTVSSTEGSRQGNNKFLLHQHLEQAGLPVFDTCAAASAGELPECLESLRRLGYARAVLKSQVGASGIGMLKVSTRGGRPEIPEYMFFEGPCLVQGWLDEEVDGVTRVGSPSVQMFVGESQISLYDWTEQILSGESVHEGNVSPPPYLEQHPDLAEQLLEQAAVAGRWLHGQGYRGTASVDLVVVLRRHRLEVLVCEVNARVTGATYPAVLARRFRPRGAWLMRNLRFRTILKSHELIRLLRDSGFLFHPGAHSGVLPINFNEAGYHEVEKGQFLCLGDLPSHCEDMLRRVEMVLPVEWEYDRD